MPTFHIKYHYTEEGYGDTFIEAESEEEAQEKFDEGDFIHDDNEILDGNDEIEEMEQCS